LRAGVAVMWVEIVCSDPTEHRRRVETRTVDVAGLDPPDWRAVIEREYHDWDRERLTVDTAGCGVDDALEPILAALRRLL
jgi:hypothetical protein